MTLFPLCNVPEGDRTPDLRIKSPNPSGLRTDSIGSDAAPDGTEPRPTATPVPQFPPQSRGLARGPHLSPSEYLADLARAELSHHDDTWRPALRPDIAARLAEHGVLVARYVCGFGADRLVMYRRGAL